jgi:hypothetical protein
MAMDVLKSADWDVEVRALRLRVTLVRTASARRCLA